PSVLSHGDDSIILANPQMVSNPAEKVDDPFDMFNDFIIDIPASPLPAVYANSSNEIVIVVLINSQ
ncbi:hypothetical protein MKW92_042283, partial [Papaver armeniacum]